MSSRFQSQAVLRAILENSRDIIFALDRDYRYLAFNENHARAVKYIWGADIQVGDDMLAAIEGADDRSKLQRNFERALRGESFSCVEAHGDERMQRRSYENVYSPIRDEEGNVLGLTVFLTDVSERRRIELELEIYRKRVEELVKQREELELAHAQLLHAQKHESLGTLAGGIAHDFNNLLAVILGRAEMSNSALPKDSAVRAHLSVIHETALEARMLTKQLLAYAGRAKYMVQLTTLDELVESMAQLLRATVDPSIQLAFALDASASPVEVDVTQLSQVLMDLVGNAADAIGERPGAIQVRTRTLHVDEQLLKQAGVNPGIAPGPYACLEVQDDGCGMDEQVRRKLFDPFFTTKVSARGLGLSAVLGIVTSHRGTILLRTAPAGGSCFSVLLPVARTVTEQPCVEAGQAAEQARRRRGLVLVVDDEEPVREVTCDVLESLGYEVLQAEGGQRACELLRAQPGRIDLVLLDMTMPEMDGEQTLQKLRAMRPDLRVVLMTGYAEDDVQRRFEPEQLAGFLAKPFAKRELGEVIERAMQPERAREERAR
jgi:two-component system cell cycle sensor histidine kinase/response regulator CckA